MTNWWAGFNFASILYATVGEMKIVKIDISIYLALAFIAFIPVNVTNAKMKSHVLVDTTDSKNSEMETKTIEADRTSSVKAIDSIVFDSFKGLTSNDENERVKSGLQLLHHLSKTQDPIKRDKEVKYVIKRLVRGVGASTTISRAGFFTTLVGFLKTVNANELDVKTILDIAKKELHVGKSVNNKEDADAVVGHVLTCGALIRSKKVTTDTDDGVENICQTLLTASKYRTYHNTLAYSFLVELLEHITEDQFSSNVWPILSDDLTKPWDNQTIQSVHCLIVAAKRFPKILTSKYLKANFGGSNILNPKTSNHLFKLFWENTSVAAITHPSYECFACYIASSKYLETFWQTEVDASLKSPTKLCEIETLKIFSDMLASADPKEFQASKYLTENFIIMMIESLKRVKFKKEEILKTFYDSFFENLFKWSAKLQDDTEKVEIVKKLIFHPGSVTLEKYTTQRIIHQIISTLSEDGVKQIFDIYKNIFLAKTQKGMNKTVTNWSNAERQCAGYMLQHLLGHKNIQSATEWRQMQLKFLMICSLFYTNDGIKVISKTEASENITSDLAEQMNNVFYASLQSKLPRLQDERDILLSLADVCNKIMEKKNPSKFIRVAVNEKIIQGWREMYNEISKEDKSDNKLKLVFHILLLHMGLQLFRDPEMAEGAIRDLEKCTQKTLQQKMKKKSKKSNSENDGEPEWIEVVVDLFLHLLSHNASTLRNVVNAVLPHLCDNLSLTAVHQILSVLDMKDGKNPLSEKNENDENMDEDDDKDETDESEGEDSENDAEDDDEDEEIVEEEEEEGTYTDALRNAVSQALIGNKKDDQDSVDLNDMDEEEGKRLDEALCGIFKSMVKPKQYKKTKGYRVELTTTMHFRIRVLDLLEIYLNHKPSLLIAIEIMITLFNMIEYCTDSELQPLANKVEKVLGKLTALRHFNSVADVTEKNISDYLRLIIEKKVNAPASEIHNRMKAKCCVFLIACTKLISENNEGISASNSEILKLFEEYLNDFIKSRNPTITSFLLNDVFKMRWNGIWRVALHLIDTGLTESTRTYRRIQILELLDTLYKNHEAIRLDQKVAKKSLKTIEKKMATLIQSLSIQDNVSLREFNAILNVLFSANRCHMKISLSSHFDNESLCENIQKIRKKIKLDNAHNYARFCNLFKVKLIRNDEVINQNVNHTKMMNGHVTLEVNGDHTMDTEESDSVNAEEEKCQTLSLKKNKKQKPKLNQSKNESMLNGNNKRKASKNKIDNRKEKRLRKEERMRALSKGLDAEKDDSGGDQGKSSGNSSYTDE